MLKRRELLIRGGMSAVATLLGSVGSWAGPIPSGSPIGTLLVSSCPASRQFADAFNAANGHTVAVERRYQSGAAHLAELCTTLVPPGSPLFAVSRNQAQPHYLAGLVSRGDWEIVDILLSRRLRLHEIGLASTADHQLFTATGTVMARRALTRSVPAIAPRRSLGAASYVAFLYQI
ncbi:MAG: hypothetical protein RBS88_13170 [Spongiibacteraceae bacterium]|jgi:hypothetical protein|nr:hypothetical protein [Spongiibacteraceae bacterium]